jgi:hypothetical protein
LALERIQGDTKVGLEWLTGLNGIGSIRELPSLTDKLISSAIKLIGWGFDSIDDKAIKRLRQALATRNEHTMIDPIASLAASSASRMMRLGYMVPRAILLREAGFANGVNAEIISRAALYLSALSQQYLEHASTHLAISRCYSVALSFALEASRFCQADQSSVANQISNILIGSYYRGISAKALRSIRWDDSRVN